MLLLQAGKRLQSCVRDSDFIARLGGDEFTAIITHNLKDKIADVLANRIKKEFNTPFIIYSIKITCPISVGTASYPTNSCYARSILSCHFF